jgi:hypothetical protein
MRDAYVTRLDEIPSGAELLGGCHDGVVVTVRDRVGDPVDPAVEARVGGCESPRCA